MRSTTSTITSLAAFATTALAHYNFEALIVNGNVTSPYEYVRQTTNANSPVTDVTSPDFVCNQGGLDADVMARTATHAVRAGDAVGFTVNAEIGHPGPLSVYLSRASSGGGAARDYDGSGDWFKVYALTTSAVTEEGLQWATYVGGGISNFTFALPDGLEAGEYLMRAEHIALHGASSEGGAQFYIGCAQLRVEDAGSGSGSGSGAAAAAAPPDADTVSIPGVYDGSEPGILINIYYPVPTNYTDPGPATWPAGCEDHTANFVGQASDGDCTGSSGAPGSSSGGGASATGSGASPTATGSSSAAPVASAASAAGVSSGSGSDGAAESSASESDESCASRRKRRSAHKKRAAQAKKNGLGLVF